MIIGCICQKQQLRLRLILCVLTRAKSAPACGNPTPATATPSPNAFDIPVNAHCIVLYPLSHFLLSFCLYVSLVLLLSGSPVSTSNEVHSSVGNPFFPLNLP